MNITDVDTSSAHSFKALGAPVRFQAIEELRGILSRLPEDLLRTALDSLEPAALQMLTELVDGMDQAARTAIAILGDRTSRPLPEESRLATNEELERIRARPVLALVKESTLEYAARDRGCSLDEMLEHFRREGSDWQGKLAGHQAHHATLEAIRREFPGVQLFNLRELADVEFAATCAQSGLILIAGGDDHLKPASRFVQDNVVVPINSDPTHSTGALCPFTALDLPQISRALWEGTPQIEEWQRLDSAIEVGDPAAPEIIKLPPALSEIRVRSADSDNMMHAEIACPGRQIRLRNSGLLIATGAGATGWFTSSGKYRFPGGRIFPKTAPHIEFVGQEPYGITDSSNWGEIGPGEELVVVSTSKHLQQFTLDSSVLRFEFPRGSRLRVSLSTAPLKVLRKTPPLTPHS